MTNPTTNTHRRKPCKNKPAASRPCWTSSTANASTSTHSTREPAEDAATNPPLSETPTKPLTANMDFINGGIVKCETCNWVEMAPGVPISADTIWEARRLVTEVLEHVSDPELRDMLLKATHLLTEPPDMELLKAAGH
jgi:hypothetical protein